MKPSAPITSLHDWVAERSASAPPALRATISSMLPTHAPLRSEREAAELFASSAASETQRIIDAGIQSRETALDVLAIDALVTYALEVAAADPASLDACVTHVMRTLIPATTPQTPERKPGQTPTQTSTKTSTDEAPSP